MSLLDFDKVQTDYLKASLKTSHKGGMCQWFFSHDDEKENTILSDGHFLAVVPDRMCFVKSNGREISPDIIRKNLVSEHELVELIDTGTSRQIIPGKKDMVHVFKINDDEIWINEKYIAYFEKMSVRYMGTGMRAPVMVYWADMFLGMILPVNHK